MRVANAVGSERFGAVQSAAYSSTAGTTSAAVGAGVQRVRIVATTDAFLQIGIDPTATTSDTFIRANWPEYVAIKPGEKVSAIQSTASGTLNVTEIP